MRAATAYFAGVGTVAAAIAAGLGGGLLLGDIMSPQQPKHPGSEMTRLEQRASQWPIPARSDASQPVPYLASSQAAAAIAEPAPEVKTERPQHHPQQATAEPADTKQAQPKQAIDTNKTSPANAQPVAAVDPAASKDRAAPEDAFAKARDSDLKARDSDIKARDADVRREARRAAEDRRKAERRQRWAERRHLKGRERGDDDLRDVEASVKEATGQRPLFGRPSSDSEPRFGSGIGLFDD